MITDQDIKNLYTKYKNVKTKNLEPEIQEYLRNRYKDSKSINESIWRILYDIEIRPTCKICGGEVEFIGRKRIIFRKTCGKECASENTSKEIKKWRAELSEEQKESIIEKTKQTCLKKYGVDHIWKTNEAKQKSSEWINSEEFKNKAKQTCLEKYGVKNPMQNEEISHKAAKTYKERGYESHWKYDNPMKKQECLEKRNKTNQERYGGNSPGCDPEVKKKQIQTRYDKYQGKYTIYTEAYHKYLSEKRKSEEVKNKIKETCLEKYGTEYWTQSEEFKEFIKIHSKEIVEKGNATKRKNGTFNTSKPENKTYETLLEKYQNTIRNYKEERYPFNCDFYIPELDLFIECQYHWTHGSHPYDRENENDVNLANDWKNSNSKFKNNAYNTWVMRDVNKRNVAKENKLNYNEFFSFDDFKKWFETLD